VSSKPLQYYEAGQVTKEEEKKAVSNPESRAEMDERLWPTVDIEVTQSMKYFKK
jgi:hypothetical protein